MARPMCITHLVSNGGFRQPIYCLKISWCAPYDLSFPKQAENQDYFVFMNIQKVCCILWIFIFVQFWFTYNKNIYLLDLVVVGFRLTSNIVKPHRFTKQTMCKNKNMIHLQTTKMQISKTWKQAHNLFGWTFMHEILPKCFNTRKPDLKDCSLGIPNWTNITTRNQLKFDQIWTPKKFIWKNNKRSIIW